MDVGRGVIVQAQMHHENRIHQWNAIHIVGKLVSYLVIESGVLAEPYIHATIDLRRAELPLQARLRGARKGSSDLLILFDLFV